MFIVLVVVGGFTSLSEWVCLDVSGSGGGWVFKNIFLWCILDTEIKRKRDQRE